MSNSYAQSSQDSAWKDIIEELLEEFLAFFFPHMYSDIDFSKGYSFLDKELQKIIKSDEIGKRYADKLVNVFLKTGEEKWLLIHVEVQGYTEPHLVERMFIYNYRIFNRYKKEVISAVILTDTDSSYRPRLYYRERWGFRLEMEFPLVKLIDYCSQEKALKKSSNPFALATIAFLRYSEEKGSLKRLYEAKKELLTVLFEKNFSKRYIQALFKFIDWLLQLPEALEWKIENEIYEVTGGKTTMPYVTSWERMAAKRAAVKAKKEDAEKMLEEGLDIAQIIRITGLTKEKVHQIKDELESKGC